MNKLMNERMNEWKDEWMHEWMKGALDVVVRGEESYLTFSRNNSEFA